MILLTVTLATLLPVGYYIFIGLKRESRPTSLDDYFIYSKQVSAKDFANTTVGYSLQMAALFLFADWGARYGFGAFWVPLFWALGFWFLYKLVPKFGGFISGKWTLHGYLKGAFDSKSLQILAAIATIIGLWGTMMAEIDYATSIYQPFFPEDSSISLYVLGMCFLAFGFVYIVYGGYKAEVNTERIQVPVAYSALLLVIIILVQGVYYAGHSLEFYVLSALLAGSFALMIKAKLDIEPGHKFADKQIYIPITALAVQLLLTILSISHSSSITLAPSTNPVFSNLKAQVGAQGLIGLISLLIANAAWQFVDISSWQRISSIKIIPQDEAGRYAPLRRGIWRVMIESPVSWAFGIIFGMTLKYSGFLGPNNDPSAGVANFVGALRSGQASIAFLGTYSWMLYPLLTAAVVAIMLSTIDALISAIAFTSYYDFQPRKHSLLGARLWAFGITAFGGLLYYGIRYLSKIDIQTFLYAAYASQISLLPTVVATFFPERLKLNKWAAIVSILTGIVVAFIAAFTVINKPGYEVSPPLFAFIASAVVFLIISSIWGKTKLKQDVHASNQQLPTI